MCSNALKLNGIADAEAFKIYEQAPNRSIMCIDMRCFFASCMAMLENIDPLQVPIAVVGNFQQKGSIVLAASPPMKKRFGIKTGSRRYVHVFLGD